MQASTTRDPQERLIMMMLGAGAAALLTACSGNPLEVQEQAIAIQITGVAHAEQVLDRLEMFDAKATIWVTEPELETHCPQLQALAQGGHDVAVRNPTGRARCDLQRAGVRVFELEELGDHRQLDRFVDDKRFIMRSYEDAARRAQPLPTGSVFCDRGRPLFGVYDFAATTIDGRVAITEPGPFQSQDEGRRCAVDAQRQPTPFMVSYLKATALAAEDEGKPLLVDVHPAAVSSVGTRGSPTSARGTPTEVWTELGAVIDRWGQDRRPMVALSTLAP